MSKKTAALIGAGAILGAMIVFGAMIRGSGRPDMNRGAAVVGSFEPITTKSVDEITLQVGEEVFRQLDEAQWPAGDAGAIVAAVEAAFPVYADLGVDHYLASLESLGLPGNEARIRDRYERKSKAPVLKEHAESNPVSSRPGEPPSTADMMRFLIETNALFYDGVKLEKINLSALRVRESTDINLATGERFNMSSAMSAQWNHEPSLGGGVSVEFPGEMSDGRAVRVLMLIAPTRVQGRVVWGLAASSFISSGSGSMPYPPF